MEQEHQAMSRAGFTLSLFRAAAEGARGGRRGVRSSVAALALFALWIACVSGPAPVAAEPSPDSSAIHSLLDRLEAAAREPGALNDSLARARESARDQAARRKAELDRLHERLLRLDGAAEEIPDVVIPPPVIAAPVAVPAAVSAQGPDGYEQAREAMAERFVATVWPLMERSDCRSCHGPTTKSPLEIPADGRAAFLRMAREGYFNAESPASLVARISAPDAEMRMPPPPDAPWHPGEISILRKFTADLFDAQKASDIRPDENFPVELTSAWEPAGGEAATASRGGGHQDNTFLSWHQLRGRVRSVFGDDWNRSETDMFLEHIDLFGGADFQRRFNESTRATASYLAGLDLMARDVISRAYLNSTGPFAGVPRDLPSPVGMDSPDDAWRGAISLLIRQTLLRDPSDEEIRRSFNMIRSVHESAARPGAGPGAGEDHDLDFEVTVTGEKGVTTVRNFSLPMRDNGLGLWQSRISPAAESDEKGVQSVRVGDVFTFTAAEAGQYFALSDRDASGQVTFAGVELIGPLPGRESRIVTINEPGAKFSGAWEFKEKDGVHYVDVQNRADGECTAELPLRVSADGTYEVHLRWFAVKKGESGEDVAVEVASADPSRLLNPVLPGIPPPGEARFSIDQTEDRIPFRDLRTSFRFDSAEQYVEINNIGTSRRVTADAIRFVPVGGGGDFLVDDHEADGRDDWPVFKDYPFRPYNIIGDSRSDENKRKGELALRYKPASKGEVWNREKYYEVQIIYPGQVTNETAVPVVVHASESSPIVRLSHPHRVPTGAEVTLDASGSYDVQHGKLEYRWRQIGGPAVAMTDPTTATLRLRTAPPDPAQSAWEGLCRVLVNHPDFLFTRPPSLYGELPEAGRRRLLLVKIAQDLVARPPTGEEFARLEAGAEFGEMIDHYLSTPEFESFYFRRIRLYLESHGSAEEDEAVRLWTYILREDRPFGEILTADYSVDESMNRVERPAYHGRTGLLTMKGFIKGKPGLPHFNYAAQVAEKFLGYIFEVPPEIVEQRDGITAVSTTNPNTLCYSCHKVLTPLANQRLSWDDEGRYRTHDERGLRYDASDQNLVPSYPYRGSGMEAFALSAQRKERFVRTIIDTHFTFYFGRNMRHDKDERDLYRRLWDAVTESDYSLRTLIRTLMTGPEYLGPEFGVADPAPDAPGVGGSDVAGPGESPAADAATAGTGQDG